MAADIVSTDAVWWYLFRLFTAVGLVIAGGVTLFYIYTLFRYRAGGGDEEVKP
jgi:heme/copper-type cytochrome/quinol oxidase subunit 2